MRDLLNIKIQNCTATRNSSPHKTIGYEVNTTPQVNCQQFDEKYKRTKSILKSSAPKRK